MERKGCVQVDAHTAVRQGQFEGKRICGTRGGVPFVNVTRVDKDGYCPKNTAPCVPDADPENIVCYDIKAGKKNCPITDLKFVKNSEVDAYIANNYNSYEFNSTTSIVTSRLTNSLPPTSIQLEHAPCIDGQTQSAIPKTSFFPAEIMRMENGCPMETNSKLSTDPRFTSSSFVTNEYDV